MQDKLIEFLNFGKLGSDWKLTNWKDKYYDHLCKVPKHAKKNQYLYDNDRNSYRLTSF